METDKLVWHRLWQFCRRWRPFYVDVLTGKMADFQQPLPGGAGFDELSCPHRIYFTSYLTPTERTMSVVVSRSHIWLLEFVFRFFFASSCGFEGTMLLSFAISRCRSTRASYLFSFHHFVIKIEYNIKMNLFYCFLGSFRMLLEHSL